ncbi:MAG: DsbA family protein [Algicola sp.]|nr:DsbA family protein [Algicola sp.]
MKKTILYYVYDPMCSWCWGYRPAWQALKQHLESLVDIQYRVGGLAPDSDLPMPADMQTFLQGVWHKINNQLGTQFNHDFWTQCQPRRSTYPACRAVLIAREHGLEQAMYLAIQEAYYLNAKNPADIETLVELAQGLGLCGKAFAAQLTSSEVNQQLLDEIAEVRKMPIQGFPSLVLMVDGHHIAIPLDYQHWQTSYQAIAGYLQPIAKST